MCDFVKLFKGFIFMYMPCLLTKCSAIDLSLSNHIFVYFFCIGIFFFPSVLNFCGVWKQALLFEIILHRIVHWFENLVRVHGVVNNSVRCDLYFFFFVYWNIILLEKKSIFHFQIVLEFRETTLRFFLYSFFRCEKNNNIFL